MPKKKIHASKLLNRLLKLTLGKYLKKRFNMHFDDEVFRTLKPPYIIFANHTNTWDPFLLSIPVPEAVHFVTSDIHFRGRKLRWLLRLAGCIPKSKFVSDADTIKSILSIKKRKGIIGVFPEGERSWDGKTLPLLYPTAKLVKLLKIPVVACLMKGVHLSLPRWGTSSRNGKMLLSYRTVLLPQDIEQLSVEKIYKVLTQSLAHDEYAFQQQNRIPFIGKKAAEYLELYLFTCPDCKSFSTLYSSGDRFSCKHCGYEVQYDAYGFFQKVSGELVFKHPGEWNQWQCEHLKSLMLAAHPDSGQCLFTDHHVSMKTGNRRLPMKDLKKGSLMLYPGRLVFKPDQEDPHIFEFEKISGINVQWNYVLEFYYENTLYSFTFENRRVSANKWVQAVHLTRPDKSKEMQSTKGGLSG